MISKIKILENQKRKPCKEELNIKRHFREIMFELDLFNKFKKTYLLDIKEKTNYGYYAHLYLATGLSYKELMDKQDVLEDNLRCMWIMKTQKFKDYAEVQIVLNPIDENVDFTNPNIKPYELYMGMSFTNKVQVNNSNKNCMYLLSGATGSGKTRYMYQVLLSWIISCTPDEVWIYLADVAKNEYIQFQNVKHIKCYASDIEELYYMMKDVRKELNRRNRLLANYRAKGLATNIEEYNKLSEDNKLPYCYIVIDELSIINTNSTDNPEVKQMKEYILDVLEQFSKLGRSSGMFSFVATQKTTAAEMPVIVKNMSTVRISFKANDAISSNVVMENSSAVGLPPRVAVYSLDGGTSIDYFYSPRLITENGRLQKMLKPYIKGKTNSNKDIKKSDRSATLDNFKVTRLPQRPKDMSYKEYLKSLGFGKNHKNREDEYNDYGS